MRGRKNLSLLEVGFSAAQTQTFFDKLPKITDFDLTLTIFSRNVRYQNVLNFDREAFSYKFTNHTWFGGEI